MPNKSNIFLFQIKTLTSNLKKKIILDSELSEDVLFYRVFFSKSIAFYVYFFQRIEKDDTSLFIKFSVLKLNI